MICVICIVETDIHQYLALKKRLNSAEAERSLRREWHVDIGYRGRPRSSNGEAWCDSSTARTQNGEDREDGAE